MEKVKKLLAVLCFSLFRGDTATPYQIVASGFFLLALASLVGFSLVFTLT